MKCCNTVMLDEGIPEKNVTWMIRVSRGHPTDFLSHLELVHADRKSLRQRWVYVSHLIQEVLPHFWNLSMLCFIENWFTINQAHRLTLSLEVCTRPRNNI